MHIGDITRIAPGGLASLGAFNAATNIDGNRTQGVTMIKVKAAMIWDGKTEGEGPLTVGIAAGVSSAEIAKMFVADPQFHEDPNSAEAANRKVFPVWLIPEIGTQSQKAGGVEGPIHIKSIGIPSWKLREDESLQWFVFNHSSGALTTGTNIEIFNLMLYKWERD